MAVGTVSKPAVRSVWGTSAAAGSLTDPGDAFGAIGWPGPNIIPPREYFNWLDNYLFNGVRYQCARGLPDWDATETFYSVGSVVIGDTGLIYAALQGGPNAAVPGTNSNKLPSANPAYWGSVGVPTAPLGDISTKMANTTFVAQAVGTESDARATAVFNETVARQTADAAEQTARIAGDAATLASAETYTNTKTASLAPLASPALTNVPTAPTAAANTSSAQLATTAFANPGASVSQNGYCKLPSGVILQWGVLVGTNTGAGVVALTFPLTFPNACFMVTASSKRATTGVVGTGQTQNLGNTPGTAFSTNGALIVCDRDVDGVLRASWFAVGH